MIDLLMIALQFAPIPTTGAYRVIEFAKRLPSHGIRPVILTIHPDQAERIFGAQRNQSLLDRLPPEVRVGYISSSIDPVPEKPIRKLFRLLTTFNDTFEKRFAKDLLLKAEALSREYDFGAVYATAPPFGAAQLGARTARALGLPYLLDMRDAWAQWSPSPQVSKLHYIRKKADERRAFGAADRIVSVTQETSDLFQKTHPDLPDDRFALIPNGLPDLNNIPDHVYWQDSGPHLDVGYVGAFYYTPVKPASLLSPHRYLQYDPGTEDWSYRSPLYFFKAWQALEELAPEIAARVRFHLVGHVPDWLPIMAESHGVADRCMFHGFKPREEVPNFLASMTCLLATSMKRIGGHDYCLASKSFEYLSSGKPILAFVCPGTQKRFFEGSGSAIFFNPDDPKGSGERLRILSGAQKKLSIDKSFLSSYKLDHTAKRMADELKEIAHTRAGASKNAT